MGIDVETLNPCFCFIHPHRLIIFYRRSKSWIFYENPTFAPSEKKKIVVRADRKGLKNRIVIEKS
jgi:hypothetical protein